MWGQGITVIWLAAFVGHLRVPLRVNWILVWPGLGCPSWDLQVTKVQRSAHVRHFLTQSRQSLSVSFGDGHLPTRAVGRSSSLPGIGHPLITPLNLAVRSSRGDVPAGIKHTRTSRLFLHAQESSRLSATNDPKNGVPASDSLKYWIGVRQGTSSAN